MLIGISGKISSGKDTLALKILERGGIHLKFADKVKEITSIISGTPLEESYTERGKEKYIESLGFTIGRLQQLIGTSLRNIHSDIWVIPVMSEYLRNRDKICVISDVRFKNEANHIKKNGGILIRINRKREIEKGKEERRDPFHISETDLDDYTKFDLIIDNNGSIEEMVEKAFKFLKLI